nr:MAG TPA: hypothetical protein [Caudoviricetes sp.]
MQILGFNVVILAFFSGWVVQRGWFGWVCNIGNVGFFLKF